MDVDSTTSTHPRPDRPHSPQSARVGEILGSWQAAEVQAARSYPECWGLSVEQLEDLYQETAIALLSRRYASETHLRNALRQGLRHRALNLHRDRRRHARILAENAPGIQRAAESSAEASSPETMAFRSEEREVILNFLTELDPFEQQVFALTADGLGYRAIAKQLDIDPNEARRVRRAIERKRAEFGFRHGLRRDRPPRHARGSLLVAPLPLLAGGLASMRRSLFGTGFSAKAGAAIATVAVIATGAAGVLRPGTHSPPERPRPLPGRQPRTTTQSPSTRRQDSPKREHTVSDAPRVDGSPLPGALQGPSDAASGPTPRAAVTSTPSVALTRADAPSSGAQAEFGFER